MLPSSSTGGHRSAGVRFTAYGVGPRFVLAYIVCGTLTVIFAFLQLQILSPSAGAEGGPVQSGHTHAAQLPGSIAISVVNQSSHDALPLYTRVRSDGSSAGSALNASAVTNSALARQLQRTLLERQFATEAHRRALNSSFGRRFTTASSYVRAAPLNSVLHLNNTEPSWVQLKIAGSTVFKAAQVLRSLRALRAQHTAPPSESVSATPAAVADIRSMAAAPITPAAHLPVAAPGLCLERERLLYEYPSRMRAWIDAGSLRPPAVLPSGVPLPRDQWSPRLTEAIRQAWAGVDNTQEVVIYNEYPFSDAFKGVQQCELPDGRPLRCLFTSLRSDIRRAKAFLRHSMVSVGPTWTDVFVRELRAWRELGGDHSARPSLVYMSLESEVNYPIGIRLRQDWRRSPASRNHSRDFMMDYRLDADVPAFYVSFHPEQGAVPVVDRKRKAVYMQSSCRPYRDNYVKELMLHFPVDSLGSCVNNVGRNESPDAHGRKAYYKNSAIYSQYKFALCLENTMGEHYVTERVFQALSAGALPIYFGAPLPELMLPPHSYIPVADYPDPRALGEYLSYLDQNDTAYQEYMRWRTDGFSPSASSSTAESMPDIVSTPDPQFPAINIGPNMRRVLGTGQVLSNCRLCIKLAHQCDSSCPCGGKLLNDKEYYDQSAWPLSPQELELRLASPQPPAAAASATPQGSAALSSPVEAVVEAVDSDRHSP